MKSASKLKCLLYHTKARVANNKFHPTQTTERSFSLLKLAGVFEKVSGIIWGKYKKFDDNGQIGDRCGCLGAAQYARTWLPGSVSAPRLPAARWGFPYAASYQLFDLTLDYFFVKLYNFFRHGLLSPFEWCVATSFYQRYANHISFYAVFYLRNLLYLIYDLDFTIKEPLQLHIYRKSFTLSNFISSVCQWSI